MLPNEMVLAPLQNLKIKYELSYQSTTRLKYIDKFDQLLTIHQWTSTVDNSSDYITYNTLQYRDSLWVLLLLLFCATGSEVSHVTGSGVTSRHVTEVTSGSADQQQQYSQSNDEESYYILETNNPVFFLVFFMRTSIL